MTPYWQSDDGRHVLYCGDCLEVLPTLNGVDAVVTDPPWKAGNGGRIHRREGEKINGVAASRLSMSLAYGDIGYFSTEVIGQFERVTSGDILVLCGFMELPEVIASIGKYRGVLIWNNTRPVPIPGPVAARDVAFIVWGGRVSQIKPSQKRWKSCLFRYGAPQGGCMATERILNRDGTTAHPAQEPLGLFVELVDPLGDTILDPYAGSGTTGVACIRTGRRSISIEIEPKYCEIAAKRMQRELAQPKLPIMEPERHNQLELIA